MLSPLISPRVIRRKLVYDLEWIPGTMELRLVGVYDGERYRSYYTMAAFLQNEFNSVNRGCWFFAHAGGLADISFVFSEIVHRMQEKKYTVDASFSGSSAIIVRITRGKNSYTMIDSYWLLRDRLAKIAESMGMKKGSLVGDDFDEWPQEKKEAFYRDCPINQLKTYNEEDCYILWHAIDRFETTVMELGGQLQPTIASTGMGLFRRRFLKKSIDTDFAVNRFASEAYVASRVEPYVRSAQGIYLYDVNSLFPFNMCKPCPAAVDRSTHILPDNPDQLFMADVEIEVPESFLPPLPMRVNNKVYFPIGRWRSWFSSVDIFLLQRTGGKILRVHEVILFHSFTDLKDYVETIYDLRKKATDPFTSLTYKLLLNCVYGKFAEGRTKQGLMLDPSADVLARFMDWDTPIADRTRNSLYAQNLFPGAWLVEREVDVPHQHVPISMMITAYSRQTLYDLMIQCPSSAPICNTDTDSLFTSNHFETSNELGRLKLEHDGVIIDQADFYSPKMYRLKLANGKIIHKAKGFSLGRGPQAEERFHDLVTHRSVTMRRMMRVRGMFRKYNAENMRPTEIPIEKRLTEDPVEKRFFYENGTSRPWTVKELLEEDK